ncbi:MAG: hypothetical protein JO352_23610 [Chloroflexi bacterium]|nr:hypothetical protein [Chloroflexota bacterium]
MKPAVASRALVTLSPVVTAVAALATAAVLVPYAATATEMGLLIMVVLLAS